MKEFLSRFDFRLGCSLIGALLLVAGCTSSQPAPIRQSSASMPAGGAASTAQSAAGTHVVRPGETLMGIGRIYGRSVSDLIAWNGLANPHQISVGQRLRVAPSGGDSSVAVAKPVQVNPVGVTGSGGITPIKQQPRGGTQPYSDQAWTSAQPKSAATPPAIAAAQASAPAATSAGWLWPANGAIIARFNESTNKGIDIAGKPGDPVIASAAGKVAYAGTGLRGYGRLVIINHAGGEYITAYAHNQKLLVKEGDTVTKGQKIAEVGSTDTDRPKLHFEIRQKGRPVNPELYLPKR